MRRTVTGIVLAAALLLPGSGLAASKQSTLPTPLSLLEMVMGWAGQLIGHVAEGTKEGTAPQAYTWGDDRDDPLPQAGTTIDANG